MNEALHFSRAAIVTRLSGNISSGGSNVPVYNRVPDNASEPYIKVYSVSSFEVDENQTSYHLDCTTRIEAVTAFEGDAGGGLICEQITSSIINLLRTRSSGYYDLSDDGFTVYTSVIDNIRYLETDIKEKTYFRSIIDLSNKVQKS